MRSRCVAPIATIAALVLGACAQRPEPAGDVVAPATAAAEPAVQSATAAAAQPAAAPAGPPGTDIWIASLTGARASLTVGVPRNLTARPGYDNQPTFAPGGAAVLFTSIRDDGQADIWRVNVVDGAMSAVSRTAESEYSATLTPDGGISVIRVERDSTQRLWRMTPAGTDFRVVLERVKPVGYHAWSDDTTLALFVLGSPPTLQLANARTGEARVMDDSIGRSIHRIPGERAFSYTRRGADGIRWMMRLDVASGEKRRLAQMPEGTEDYAWTPSGIALSAQGAELLAWDPRGTAGWTRIATLAGENLGRVTRLAVSADGRWLAFVAEEPREES